MQLSWQVCGKRKSAEKENECPKVRKTTGRMVIPTGVAGREGVLFSWQVYGKRAGRE